MIFVLCSFFRLMSLFGAGCGFEVVCFGFLGFGVGVPPDNNPLFVN